MATQYTELSVQPEIYSDFFVDLDFHPIRGDLVRKTNEGAVSQSIRNILKSSYYERPFNPKFGANLRALLFENFSPFIEIQLKTQITSAIENYEPRAELISVDVSSDVDNYLYTVTILFATKNQPNPQTLTVQLERVR